MTSDHRVVESVCDRLQQLGIKTIKILNTACMVNESVKHLKEHIQTWSRNFGNADLTNTSVKQTFTIGHRKMSSYWFTWAAEKNPLKTDLFLKIAQLRAFDTNLRLRHYQHCLVSLADQSLRISIKSTARARGLIVTDITTTRAGVRLKEAVSSNHFIWGAILRALGFLGRAFIWSLYARHILGPWKQNDQFTNPLLTLSYFPYLDRTSIINGRLVNKYFAPLQKKMDRLKITPSWLLMFVFIDGYSYKDAVRIAKRLSDKGESLTFVEQALSPAIMVKILLTWLNQLTHFLRFRFRLNQHPVHETICPASGRPLIEELLNASFCGSPAMQGIFYYFIFSKFAHGMKKTNLCIYLCEMSSWEKAFNAALTNTAPHVVKIGFQHTSIAQNYFFYFSHPKDSRRTGQATDLPLPDVLAVNGKIPYRLMQPSMYPRLEIVEALRQLHMTKQMGGSIQNKRKRPLLLVTASYGFLETCAMVSMLLRAFPNANGINIWLKGHPSCSMIEVCEKLDFSPHGIGYEIVDGDIDTFLESATMVMVGNSSVALDALAYGCRVIVPIFGEVINMSPILGNEDFYYIVSSAEDLKNVVNRFGKSKSQMEIEKGQSFLRKYWCLDKDLPRWERLISDYCIN